jgi:hypothetical protein
MPKSFSLGQRVEGDGVRVVGLHGVVVAIKASGAKRRYTVRWDTGKEEDIHCRSLKKEGTDSKRDKDRSRIDSTASSSVRKKRRVETYSDADEDDDDDDDFGGGSSTSSSSSTEASDSSPSSFVSDDDEVPVYSSSSSSSSSSVPCLSSLAIELSCHLSLL